MPEVGLDQRRCISLIPLVVGLVLEKYEFVGLVIGTVVAQIRHQ